MRRALAAVLLMIAAPGSALAADYPYHGVMVLAAQDKAGARVDLARCAFGFFLQGTDGSYTNYHIDLAAFRATGKPRYLKYAQGTCSHDPAAQIETCRETWSAVGGPLSTYRDAIIAITPSEIVTREFTEEADLRRWLETRDAGLGYEVRYLVCPFGAAAVEPFIAPEASSLGRGELDAVLSSMPSRDDQAVMKDVYTALGAAWPNP